jgi:serralysin
MAIYRIDPSNPLPPVYGEGESALVIVDGDTVILGQGAEIAAYGRNGWGLFGGSGNNLLINGSVHSEWETAIAAHGAITVGVTGQVCGRDAGLQLTNDSSLGRSNILNNAGIISTGEDGVAIWLHGASNVIVNSGEIRGTGGIWGYNYQPEGGSFTLYNSGVIGASGGDAIAAALFGSNHIVNTGHIDGGIILGSENDFYDGRDGTWSFGAGDIRLREGDDVFYGGSSREFVHADEGNDTVDGGGGDDRLLGRSGDDLLRGGSGDDIIRGESGVDVATFSGLLANYTISRRADGSFVIIDNRAASNDGRDVVTGVEYLQFADRTVALTTPNSAPTSAAISNTIVDDDVPAGTVVGQLSGTDPDGDALGYFLVANPGGHFRIHGDKLLVDRAFSPGDTNIQITVRASDPHGASINRQFTINVTSEIVTIPRDPALPFVAPTPVKTAVPLALKGGRKADLLLGGAGDDQLNGGLGHDRLTGGEGSDVFVFSTKLKANVDRITDFSGADDTIRLSKAVFGKLQKGVLSKEAFRLGAKAVEADDRIVFNAKTGAVLYDADGSGTAHAAVTFAKVKAGTLLTADDFLVL